MGRLLAPSSCASSVGCVFRIPRLQQFRLYLGGRMALRGPGVQTESAPSPALQPPTPARSVRCRVVQSVRAVKVAKHLQTHASMQGLRALSRDRRRVHAP